MTGPGPEPMVEATPARPLRRRLVASSMAVALLAAVLGTGLGLAGRGDGPAEPHPSSLAPRSGVAPDAGRAQAERAGIDPERVVETVSHHVAPDPDRPDVLVAEDDAYRASFEASGFALRSPRGAEAFSLSLEGLTRGEDPMALVPGPWRGEANVATRPVGPGVTERVTAREGEVEWDLVLAARPAGRGDLVAEARVEGIDSVALGRLVVTDATGAELHRASPRVTGDRLRLSVPAPVLERARYPLVLDPTVTPEFFVSPTPAAQSQTTPAVAVGPSGDYLVVWEDDPFAASNIVGTRVSRSGTLLDPAGIPISQASESQERPRVAFDGTNFLVVWLDSRSLSTSFVDIYGARVGPTGIVLDPDGIPLSTAPQSQLSPDVAFDGTNYLVVWDDRRLGTDDIFGARVTIAGTVLDPDGIPVSTAPDRQLVPDVAFDGTNYLVVWEDRRLAPSPDVNVFGARVNPAGLVLDPTVPVTGGGLPVSTATGGQFRPALAFDGTNYLVVWHDDRAGSFDIFGARVTIAGIVVDTAGIPIATAPQDQVLPAVAFDGTNHHVVWGDDGDDSDGFDVLGARVSTDGSVAGSGTVIGGGASPQFSPAVAFDGTRLLVVWEDARAGTESDVFGTRLERSGFPNPFVSLISTRANTQSTPAVVANGPSYFVVWMDARAGNADVYGARVTGSGTVLDPAGIPIATGTAGQGPPAVAFDGSNYLVVWGEGFLSASDVRGRRVSPGGGLLGSSFPVAAAAGAQVSPVVAFDGTNHLVVWADNRTGSFDILGARVSTSGTVQDPDGRLLSPTDGVQSVPAVSFGGGSYLVVWQQGPFQSADLFASRVSTGGTALGTPGFPISTAPNDQAHAAVASDGTNHLVVWDDRRLGSPLGPYDVFGTRVDSSGVVLDPAGIPISTAPDSQDAPAVAFNGAFLVAWHDKRSGGFDVFGARVGTNGSVLDGSGFAIAASSTAELSPALTSGGPWGAVYQRDYPGGRGIFLRRVAPK